MNLRVWVAVAAAAAAGCSSTAGIRQCTQLSGFYEPGACRQEEPKPLTDLKLPDGSPLAGVKRITVEQDACNSVTIKSKDRADIVLHPEDDSLVYWDQMGALVGGTSPKTNVVVVVGFSRSAREWRIGRSNDGTGLTYSDARDEHGMALLFIPFHNRTAASCEWVRVAEQPAATAVRSNW